MTLLPMAISCPIISIQKDFNFFTYGSLSGCMQYKPKEFIAVTSRKWKIFCGNIFCFFNWLTCAFHLFEIVNKTHIFIIIIYSFWKVNNFSIFLFIEQYLLPLDFLCLIMYWHIFCLSISSNIYHHCWVPNHPFLVFCLPKDFFVNSSYSYLQFCSKTHFWFQEN